MSPNVRRPVGYGLFATVVALSTLLSVSILAMVPQASQFTIHNSQFTIRDSQFVTTTIPLTTGVSPWPRALAVDESLGLAYLADGERGTVTIVAGTTFVSTMPAGQEVADIAVDAGTGFVYATAPDPYALYDGHVAVIRGGKVISRVITGGKPRPVAVDSRHKRAYVGVETGGPFDQVVVLQRDNLIAVVSVPPDVIALDVDPVRGRAYAVNKLFPHLTIINGTSITGPPIPLNDVGVPQDIAVDPVSGLVYVVGQSPFHDAGTVVVISDTQQIAQLATGPDPRHAAVDPHHGRVYVTNAGNDTVTIIAGTEIISTVNVGSSPGAIAVDPRHDRVYVSNAGDGTTTVLSGQAVVTTLSAGGGPLAVDTEGGVAYLAGDGLAVAQGDTLLGRLPKAAMPGRLAVNSETGLAYACNQGTDTLSVLSDTEILATLPLSSTPQEVAVDPVSGWVYVAQDAELTVVQGVSIDATLPITARDIALDPLRRLAYAASNGVAVIRDMAVLGTIDLGQPPRGVVVNRATGLAYATAGDHEDGFVAVISGTERIGMVSTGGMPGKLVVDPVRDRVFVLHPEQGRLSVIEGTRRHFPSLFLPRPALDAAVNPLTGEVYVATRGPLVLVQGLDGGMIDLGLETLAVAVDVKRGIAYATTRDGRVAVLDGADVLTTLAVGHRPVDLTIDSQTGRVYVANYGSDTITVIERRRPPDVYLPFISR